MISLCIKNNNTNIIDYLISSFSEINMDDIYLSRKAFSKYNNIILHYTGTNEAKFYSEGSNIICSCILQFYENMILKNIILLNYFYFDYSDILTIEKNCIKLLSPTKPLSDNLKHNLKQIDNDDLSDKNICLWTSVLKYITNNKSMILDGFVRFRIGDYIKYLDSAVDNAVNQFVIDKEYFDFINLLQLYVGSKSPLCDLVHLIYIDGESILLDNNKNIISITKNNLDINYLSDISFSSNDYALNSLLTLLPKKLIIHLVSDEDEFINTIKLVFEDKYSICTDCNICQTYKLLHAKQF